MRFVASLFSFLLIAVIFLLLGAIALTIILAFALGIAWILGRLFGFTLFEGAVLAMLAAIIGGGVLLIIRGGSASPRSASRAAIEDDEDEEDEEDYDVIPSSRFTETSGRTFQSWCEYELSNSIYTTFQDEPKQVAFMNASQQQELAIRLAQSAVAVLKGKTGRSISLQITRTQIERQLRQTGQMPYDDGIMEMAVKAIDMELESNHSAYEHIITLRLWNKTSEWWDEVEVYE